MSKSDWPELQVFVSYSRADKDFADGLAAALEQNENSNIKILIDRRDLPYGEKWWDMLVDFIERSDRVIFIVSPDSIRSNWCKKELDKISEHKRRLVPIVARETPVAELPDDIRAINLMPFSDPKVFDANVARLISTMYQNVEWTRHRRFIDQLADHWEEQKRPRSLLLGGDQMNYFRDWLQKRPPVEPTLSAASLAYMDHSGFFSARDDHFREFRRLGDSLGSMWMWWLGALVGVLGVSGGVSFTLASILPSGFGAGPTLAISLCTALLLGGPAGFYAARALRRWHQEIREAFKAKESEIERYGALTEARAAIAAQERAEADAAELARLRAKEWTTKRATRSETKTSSSGPASESKSSSSGSAAP